MRTTFIRLLASSDRPRDLRAVCMQDGQGLQPVFAVDVRTFRVIPRSTFAYWAPVVALDSFETWPPLESAGRHAAAGASTKDNSRFVRGWWEVPTAELSTVEQTGAKIGAWVPLAKGGAHGRFFADVYLQLRWAQDGRELKAFTGAWRAAKGWGDHWKAELHNSGYYNRPGVTWPSRSQVGFSARAMPAGGVFGDKGPAVFVPGDDTLELSVLVAVMNSAVFRYLVSLQMAFGSYETGVTQRTPLPPASREVERFLSSLMRECWSLTRDLDAASETSHAFVAPAVLRARGSGFDATIEELSARNTAAYQRLEEVQAKIDAVCFDLYGVGEEERRSILEGFTIGDLAGDGDDTADGEVEDADDAGLVLDQAGLAAGLVSWAVGVGVGRFDVRLATGEREGPSEPDPFDPLPACSPGMLTGEDGLPVEPPVGYPVVVSPVMVTDPGHPLDIGSRVRSVFEAVFGEAADAWLSDVGSALGARGGEVDGWLAKGFFDHHLKTYSRSRRKAPLLWPVGTKSGSYLVWLYAHRATADSLFRIVQDVVLPKLAVEGRELAERRQEAGPSPSASQRKAIDAQEKLVGELRELREELDAVAPLWAPDLNDGIVIVLAPLWRLFAHHRAWSAELKKHWVKLVKGDCDWAQLAMHLWPERVVPKCAQDRSLAIAHGLEDVFWIQDATNTDKWHPRQTPTIPIDELVAARHNPATHTALQRATT
jgi:hypothetical protein